MKYCEGPAKDAEELPWEGKDEAELPWHTSSRSGQDGECVEVVKLLAVCGVRDSKNRDGGELWFSRDEWMAFINGIQRGEFG